MNCELTQRIRDSLEGERVSARLREWMDEFDAGNISPVQVAWNPVNRCMDIPVDIGITEDGYVYARFPDMPSNVNRTILRIGG